MWRIQELNRACSILKWSFRGLSSLILNSHSISCIPCDWNVIWSWGEKLLFQLRLALNDGLTSSCRYIMHFHNNGVFVLFFYFTKCIFTPYYIFPSMNGRFWKDKILILWCIQALFFLLNTYVCARARLDKFLLVVFFLTRILAIIVSQGECQIPRERRGARVRGARVSL